MPLVHPIIEERMDPFDLPTFIRAVDFAARKHRDQRRKDAEATPYINHPIALARVLVEEGGVRDEAVLIAAILHDTIEDTETTAEELEAAFGPAIAGIVLEVTDDTSLAKAERKAAQVRKAPHKTPEAKLVKLADKICNVRDLLASPPAGWDRARLAEYVEWSERVVAGLCGSNPGLEMAFDVAAAEGRARFAEGTGP